MPPPTHLLGPEVEKTKSTEEHSLIVQQFEISDPIAKACWYKDGTQIYPKRDPETSSQALPLQLKDMSDDEPLVFEASGEAQLNVDLKGGVPQPIQ